MATKKLEGRDLAHLLVQVAEAGEQFTKSVRNMQDRKQHLANKIGQALEHGVTTTQLKGLLPGLTARALSDLAQEQRNPEKRDESLKQKPNGIRKNEDH